MIASVTAIDPVEQPDVINGLVTFNFAALTFSSFKTFCLVAHFLFTHVYPGESQALYHNTLWGAAAVAGDTDGLDFNDREAFLWLKYWRSYGVKFGLSITGTCSAPGCRCAFMG